MVICLRWLKSAVSTIANTRRKRRLHIEKYAHFWSNDRPSEASGLKWISVFVIPVTAFPLHDWSNGEWSTEIRSPHIMATGSTSSELNKRSSEIVAHSLSRSIGSIFAERGFLCQQLKTFKEANIRHLTYLSLRIHARVREAREQGK